MTLRVQGTITVNGTQAKSELKAVGTELKKVGADGTAMARGTKEAAGSTRLLEQGAASAASDLRLLAGAERQAAQDAVMLGRSHTMGAGGVANLTAQFNDIGVMLAAGQNPLQLAIQQGTQITQVFGAMGAGAAVRGLGQALLSMVSPLNLITIGSIAVGAAMFQWLAEAGDEAVSLEDQIDNLSSTVDSFAKAAKNARMPADEMAEAYGRMAGEAKRASQAIAEAERATSQRVLSDTATNVSQSFGGFDGPKGDLIGSDYEETLFRIRSELDLTGNEAFEVAQKLRALSEANGPEGIARAALAARDALVEVGVAANNELAMKLANLSAEAAKFIGSLADNGVVVNLSALLKLQADGIREVIEAEQERLAVQTAQEVVQNQILLFGRDSELVAQNRLAAEREIYAAALDAAGATAQKAAQELAAWDAAVGFNAEAAGMPGLMTATANAAAQIAGGIWKAVTAMAELNAAKARSAAYDATGNRTGLTGPDGIRAEQWGGGRLVAPVTGAGLPTPKVFGGTGRSRSGSAKAAREEKNAVADLIAKLQDEIALEREMDPIKREMIKHREALKNATAAEREQVEQLIVQREREKAATESLRWVGEQTGDALIDALMGGADAGERLIETLKRAVLQALLLGQGPLGGLFGGGGGLLGGLGLGGLFGGGAAAPALADGGMVYGPGGPRDDKVAAWLSPGEFVVNARATRQNRHMLQMLNEAPAFAEGGMVQANRAASFAALARNEGYESNWGAEADDPALQTSAKVLIEAREFARKDLVTHALSETLAFFSGGIVADAERADLPEEGMGMVYGPGGPRDDKVAAWLSPGEFVVNARATRRHRNLLDNLNEAPAFANGGIVGGGGSTVGSAASGGDFHAHFDLRGSQGETSIRKAAMEGMQAALTEYRRSGLPGDIRRANENPRVLRF